MGAKHYKGHRDSPENSDGVQQSEDPKSKNIFNYHVAVKNVRGVEVPRAVQTQVKGLNARLGGSACFQVKEESSQGREYGFNVTLTVIQGEVKRYEGMMMGVLKHASDRYRANFDVTRA
ncbi:MAG: hypothetical protein Q8Q31_02620 [Nanoarchaeota archaeon]|nr:hypothetical protein [Nanoarchaeota archaeon]